jgi:zeta-carotene desaturase
MPSPHVAVAGGGLAGLSASVALADSGFRVSLLEKSPRLGGRATSYELPGGETIDNCQHVTLRCCTNLADFYRRARVADKIRYYDYLNFAGPNGRRAQIKSSRLPAPLHLAPGFAAFAFLDWKDKRGIARALLRIVRNGGRLQLPGTMTMFEWLKAKQNQTARAIDRFWAPVLVSALNEDLRRMDAAYGVAVFWKVFLSNPQGFAMGIPSVPLAELYTFGHEHIEMRTRAGVAEILLKDDTCTAVRLDDGSQVSADYFVVAIPFDRLLKILPERLRGEPQFVNLSNLRVSPITSVHFWFDRAVMDEPFIAALDQTIQWVFNKANGHYVQIVISASHQLTQKSQQEIIELCRKELAELIPASGAAGLTRSVVIRENSATFSPQPGCDVFRPAQRTPVRNLFIAGDWTQTGWPATMESAVRSGYRAAEEILSLEGHEARLVQPELAVSGLAKWLS